MYISETARTQKKPFFTVVVAARGDHPMLLPDLERGEERDVNAGAKNGRWRLAGSLLYREGQSEEEGGGTKTWSSNNKGNPFRFVAGKGGLEVRGRPPLEVMRRARTLWLWIVRNSTRIDIFSVKKCRIANVAFLIKCLKTSIFGESLPPRSWI